MKTQTTTNFAKVLFEIPVSEDEINHTKETIQAVPQVKDTLCNPLVKLSEKERVIDRIFPETIRNFLKVVCKYQHFNIIEEIFTSYEEIKKEKQKVVTAVLRVITPPSENQLSRIKAFLCKQYDGQEAEVKIVEDSTIVGGFILQAGDQEYDWSTRGRFERLEQTLTRR